MNVLEMECKADKVRKDKQPWKKQIDEARVKMHDRVNDALKDAAEKGDLTLAATCLVRSKEDLPNNPAISSKEWCKAWSKMIASSDYLGRFGTRDHKLALEWRGSDAWVVCKRRNWLSRMFHSNPDDGP